MELMLFCTWASNEDVTNSNKAKSYPAIYELRERLQCVLEPKRRTFEFEKPKWCGHRAFRTVCRMNSYSGIDPSRVKFGVDDLSTERFLQICKSGIELRGRIQCTIVATRMTIVLLGNLCRGASPPTVAGVDDA